MTIRRQLVNLGTSCVDFRAGVDAFDELSSMFKSVVGVPKRAVLICEDALAAQEGVTVSRALIDAGFRVEDLALPAGERIVSIGYAAQLYDAFDEMGITADDLLVGLGGVDLCSLVAFCSRTWCGGTSCALVPTTLEAMTSSATSMRALDTSLSREMVSLAPKIDLCVCEINLLLHDDFERAIMGRLQLMLSALAESKRVWDQFSESLPKLLRNDPLTLLDDLCMAQTARSGVIKAANPSARHALMFGTTTAQALRVCLGPDVPWYRLLAEGMRFEARLAHDVCDLDIDLVFAIDDMLYDMGIDELAFSTEAQTLVSALKSTRFKRANRFMFALPKIPGSIRLAVVEDEVLARHVDAYVCSRAELVDADNQ